MPTQDTLPFANGTMVITIADDGTITTQYDADGNGTYERVEISSIDGSLTTQYDDNQNGTYEVVEVARADGTVTRTTNTTDTPGGPTTTEVICLLEGTLILTPDGEQPIESLHPGDRVVDAEGRVHTVRWIGRQLISRQFSAPERAIPIRIRKDALADGVPSRDLLVSQRHAIHVDGILAQAGALVNGLSILRETHTADSFRYYNIELDVHTLIVADGAPVESFVDNVPRNWFDNWDERELLGLCTPIPEMALPRAKSQRQVPQAIQRRLAQRAAALNPSQSVA